MLSILIGLSASLVAAAQDGDPDVLVFYRAGCHECERMETVLAALQAEYPQLKVRAIEEAAPDADLMWSLAGKLGVFPTAFPVIFVGDVAIVGASRNNELRLRAAIEDCMANGCPSPLSLVQESRLPWRTILIAALVGATLLILALSSSSAD
jgi:glutaredoxin